MNLRLHEFLPRTQSEGPGERACVFVHGCPIHCPGCFNTATWDPHVGYVTTVDEVFARITAQSGLEGVTFVGGERYRQTTTRFRTTAQRNGVGVNLTRRCLVQPGSPIRKK